MSAKYEYEIQGRYDHQYGFEMVTCEETFPEARKRLKEYRENEPGVLFRIKRVKAE